MNLKKYLPAILLTISIIAYTVVFYTLRALRYEAFFSYEWGDLAWINTIYWNIAHGNLIGFLEFMFMHGKHPIGFHIAPFIVLISPIYALFPSVHTLFFLISFSLAIAAVPIYLIAVKVLENRMVALGLALAYLFYAPKNSLNFVTDPTVYALPLLLFAFYFAMTGKKKRFIVFSAFVMMLRTVTASFVLPLVAYFTVKKEEFNKIPVKIYYWVGAAAVLVVITNLIVYNLMSLDAADDGTREIWPFIFLLSERNFNLLKLLLPLLFLPVFSWEILLGLPGFLMFEKLEFFTPNYAYYFSSVYPALFISTIYALKKIRTKYSPAYVIRISCAVLVACIISNCAPNITGDFKPLTKKIIKDTRFVGVYNMYDPVFYRMDANDVIAWEMINQIPKDPNIKVAASGDLMAPLSSRKILIEFLCDHYDYLDVDYILINMNEMYLGSGEYFWDEERMKSELNNLIRSPEWVQLDHKGPFYLFKRVR